MQIRNAMKEYGELLEGIVEADETYVGGKNKNRHDDKKTKGDQGSGGSDKQPVFGVVQRQRQGKVKVEKVNNVSKNTLNKEIKRTVTKNSTIMTDEWLGYNELKKIHYRK